MANDWENAIREYAQARNGVIQKIAAVRAAVAPLTEERDEELLALLIEADNFYDERFDEGSPADEVSELPELRRPHYGADVFESVVGDAPAPRVIPPRDALRKLKTRLARATSYSAAELTGNWEVSVKRYLQERNHDAELTRSARQLYLEGQRLARKNEQLFEAFEDDEIVSCVLEFGRPIDESEYLEAVLSGEIPRMISPRELVDQLSSQCEL